MENGESYDPGRSSRYTSVYLGLCVPAGCIYSVLVLSCMVGM